MCAVRARMWKWREGVTHREQTEVEVSNRAACARSPALERILIHFRRIFRGILLSLADFRALRLSFNMEAVACPPSVQAVLSTGTHILGCPRKLAFASYRFCLRFHKPCLSLMTSVTLTSWSDGCSPALPFNPFLGAFRKVAKSNH